ncbi:MAG: pyridoxamine 5'-phosphate oxidase family protein [Eubacterium sp.]
MEFQEKLNELYNSFGDHKTMVLSTGYNGKISSRMMSIVLVNGKFCFQTDREFRKYNQIISNPNVALCDDNIQIEGICKEIGKPVENNAFCELYKKYYKASFDMYSNLQNEVLFEITPVYIQKWIYENGKPYVEVLDFLQNKYSKLQYKI